MKLLFSIASALSFAVLVACDDIPQSFDTSKAAIDGNDKSVIFHGCHEGYKNGYLFCRIREGASPKVSQDIQILFPPVKCSRDNCFEFRFFRKDGSPGPVQGVPQGNRVARVAIADIVGTEEPITMNEDGEYLVQVRGWFYDKTKHEHFMMGEGVVRVFVIREEYEPLGCNSPERGWRTNVGKDCYIETSTRYRTAICGVGC